MRGHLGPASRYIPPQSIKVCDKHSDAVAYLYTSERHGKPCAVVYYGKQSKSVAHHNYRSDAEREKSVTRFFESRRAHDAAQAKYKAKRYSPHAVTAAFEVGNTYYDRSSCDWDTIYSFKIVDRTEKTLTIEEYGKTYKRGLYVGEDGVERCKPHGTYSMCSVINASRGKTA